jgi:hypothetical protein
MPTQRNSVRVALWRRGNFDPSHRINDLPGPILEPIRQNLGLEMGVPVPHMASQWKVYILEIYLIFKVYVVSRTRILR